MKQLNEITCARHFCAFDVVLDHILSRDYMCSTLSLVRVTRCKFNNETIVYIDQTQTLLHLHLHLKSLKLQKSGK